MADWADKIVDEWHERRFGWLCQFPDWMVDELREDIVSLLRHAKSVGRKEAEAGLRKDLE